MMTKIENMQKIMISLDIFAEEKSFLNWPENLPLKYQALVSGQPVEGSNDLKIYVQEYSCIFPLFYSCKNYIYFDSPLHL